MESWQNLLVVTVALLFAATLILRLLPGPRPRPAAPPGGGRLARSARALRLRRERTA